MSPLHSILVCTLLATGSWLTASLLTTQPEASIERTLTSNQWKKRIVIISAPTAHQSAFLQQKQLLADEAAGLSERDILVVDAPMDQMNPTDKAYLQTRLGLEPGRFSILLIGKDGGVKIREVKPVPARTLFATIDGMPMRRQEMRQSKKNS